MDVAEQIAVLEATHGDPAKLALATVDLAYPALAVAKREILRQALQAAAVPHWCDSSILAAILGVPETETPRLFAQLGSLSVAERFPARGEGVVNVHEASRLAIRKWLASENADRFREFSARAAAWFDRDPSPSGRIEWIYHLLSADPELGASELEKLDREWANQARPEERYAFAVALKELKDQELVTGRAELWVSLALAWTRATRGEHALLGEEAAQALLLARALHDRRAEGDAQWLAGDVLMAQGNLPEARRAYESNLEISRSLAERSPQNAGWQRELAVAYALVGKVAAESGEKDASAQACDEAVRILRALVARYPDHSVWLQDLAGVLIQAGDLLQARDELAKAKARFAEALEISERVAAKDPTNASWQLDLAFGHSRVGDVLQAENKIEEAEEAFAQARTISESLTFLDPTHSGWQLRLAVAHNRVGNVLQLQHKFSAAQEEYDSSLAIIRRLVKKAPQNAEWQRELAIALNRVGDILNAQGKADEAQRALEEGLSIHRQLVARDPSRVEWKRDLAWACAHSGRGLAQRDAPAALSLYDEAIQILEGLVDSHAMAEVIAEKKAIAVEREQLLKKGLAPEPGEGANST